MIRCKKQDLVSRRDPATHIEAGKVVTKLALDWQERIQLVIADDASVKASEVQRHAARAE